MKLKVHEKWQWLAMDADAEWVFHAEEPHTSATGRLWTTGGGDVTGARAFGLSPVADWKKSLHRRIGDDWFPVDEVAGYVPRVTAEDDGERARFIRETARQIFIAEWPESRKHADFDLDGFHRWCVTHANNLADVLFSKEPTP